jgi:hypothetical protein
MVSMAAAAENYPPSIGECSDNPNQRLIERSLVDGSFTATDILAQWNTETIRKRPANTVPHLA